jgi:hypothetical protein
MGKDLVMENVYEQMGLIFKDNLLSMSHKEKGFLSTKILN